MTDEIQQTSEPDVSPSEEQTPPQESVDLAAEASNAAAEQPPQSQKLRSLDDLDLEGNVRRQIESYVSKAINDAVSSHDQKQQKKLDDEGFMNRSQIEDIMTQRDAEYQRRDSAKENLLSILGSEGITPGSDEYTTIQKFYADATADGRLTPHILLSDAGIRTLVAMAGVGTSSSTDSGPGSGFRSNDTQAVRLNAGGEVQLNKENARADSLDNKMREAMEKAARR
jgi:hypothetical protein|tara:strand:- start:4719 stop:5396 length:678 start_codon:yes stop_codon:yes gene_type:complete